MVLVLQLKPDISLSYTTKTTFYGVVSWMIMMMPQSCDDTTTQQCVINTEKIVIVYIALML